MFRSTIFASPEPLGGSAHLPLPSIDPHFGLVTPPNRTVSLSDVFATLPSTVPEGIFRPTPRYEVDYDYLRQQQDTTSRDDDEEPDEPVPPLRPESPAHSDHSQTPMRFAIPSEIISVLRSRPASQTTGSTERNAEGILTGPGADAGANWLQGLSMPGRAYTPLVVRRSAGSSGGHVSMPPSEMATPRQSARDAAPDPSSEGGSKQGMNEVERMPRVIAAR
ncbi:hypothetical protein BDV98DRAFT_567437 [Pterulicium gracile]|uniref:Uncharacterized protein n=1 Tax=Pterulicium gracile TaxID=1884261 RepID=A0A5C3QI51_9AGAR|nr:hypothetical protein BDV98DRAFT_567437 [Pterula gracilis]